MSLTTRRYGKEAIAQRGDAIYDRDIRPHLDCCADGEYIAIDIETGDYAIGADEIEACDQLRTRIPHAQFWLKQIGSPVLHRFSSCGLLVMAQSEGLANVLRQL